MNVAPVMRSQSLCAIASRRGVVRRIRRYGVLPGETGGHVWARVVSCRAGGSRMFCWKLLYWPEPKRLWNIFTGCVNMGWRVIETPPLSRSLGPSLSHYGKEGRRGPAAKKPPTTPAEQRAVGALDSDWLTSFHKLKKSEIYLFFPVKASLYS